MINTYQCVQCGWIHNPDGPCPCPEIERLREVEKDSADLHNIVLEQAKQIRELKGLKGVIVPVDMPKNCAECPFVHGDTTERCPFMSYEVWSEWALSEVPEEESGTERHPSCPLREMKPQNVGVFCSAKNVIGRTV